MMTTAAMLIDMGNLDCDHGDHDDAGQVISGEENGLVLLNFIPKPAMVVYNAYTQSVYFCLFLFCFILKFVCVFVCFSVCLFVCLFVSILINVSATNDNVILIISNLFSLFSKMVDVLPSGETLQRLMLIAALLIKYLQICHHRLFVSSSPEF